MNHLAAAIIAFRKVPLKVNIITDNILELRSGLSQHVARVGRITNGLRALLNRIVLIEKIVFQVEARR